MKNILLIFLFTLSAKVLFAQDTDLLGELGEDDTKTYVTNAFKSPRVISSHSMEMLPVGALDFRILHRFGQVNQGFDEFFGLDNATMRMSFDYGITKNFTAGIGRSTFKKELDGFLKYRIIQQSKGHRSFPISILWASGMMYNGLKNPYQESTTQDKFYKRVSYFHQLIIGRKFSESFSLQISPMLIHRNLVDNLLEENNTLAINLGGRYKVTKRIALVWDYTYAFGQFLTTYHTQPLSIGVDIETGGHVFQLHFSNATGMNERAYISEKNGDWFKGDIQFGFNLSRVFQVAKQKI
ncbi:MAG: DUF5777 family beta-barrel protein [Saprospiraceae bacterium]|nr:hypothetical protein [Candidatus Vicinibacter affinis]